MLLVIFFAGLGWFYLAAKKSAPDVSGKTASTTKTQPISFQAKQNYLQGQDGATPGYASRGEGTNIILQKQNSLMTDRVEADLEDRLGKTFDPQWRMRWLNALHRVRLQQNVNAGRDAGASVNVDRTVEEVNSDGGQASGWTRTNYNYQQRFTRGVARRGCGPNSERPMDQMDAGDQTAMQTPLNPNGFKSVIYPRDFSAIPPRDLQRDYWNVDGDAHNPGYTMQDMPKPEGVPLFDQIARWFTGAKTGGTGSLPSRSNINDDSIN